MNAPHSPLFWSLPCGTLLSTRIRISLWFPLLFFVLVFRVNPVIAIALTGIFLFSTLLHELVGHVLVARATGGDGHEVLLWPFGGLASVQPAATFRSQFFTAAGGPFVNLLLCLATLPVMLWSDGGAEILYRFTLPVSEFSAAWGRELLLLIFFVNWMLAVVNMLPIYPLDGGRMLEAALQGRGTSVERKTLCLKIGTIAAILVMSLGMIFDNQWIVVIGSLVLILNFLEGVNVQWNDSYDDSFMGYDFSQGYTSLERSSVQEKQARKSFWERRREARAAAKRQRELELRQREEAQLDVLLDKVHHHGFDSLTPQEKKFLQRTSKNFRTKNG